MSSPETGAARERGTSTAARRRRVPIGWLALGILVLAVFTFSTRLTPRPAATKSTAPPTHRSSLAGVRIFTAPSTSTVHVTTPTTTQANPVDAARGAADPGTTDATRRPVAARGAEAPTSPTTATITTTTAPSTATTTPLAASAPQSHAASSDTPNAPVLAEQQLEGTLSYPADVATSDDFTAAAGLVVASGEWTAGADLETTFSCERPRVPHSGPTGFRVRFTTAGGPCRVTIAAPAGTFTSWTYRIRLRYLTVLAPS